MICYQKWFVICSLICYHKDQIIKLRKKRLPLLDIIFGVEDATENISATYMKNSFRAECLNILKRGRSNDQINRNEKISRKICTWLKHNKLMVVEADKGRATCIIEEEKVNKMIETELNNQNIYHGLKKDKIDNVRSKVNKKLKELKESGLISEKLYKDLKPHTPKTPSARLLLKIRKNPLKIRLAINTQNSAVYKIGKLLSKELQQITTSGKSFIKDSKSFVENIKHEKLSDDEQFVSFDIKDKYPSLLKYDVLL